MNAIAYDLRSCKPNELQPSTFSNKNETPDSSVSKVNQVRKNWVLIISGTATMVVTTVAVVGIVVINPVLITGGAFVLLFCAVFACHVLIVRKLKNISPICKVLKSPGENRKCKSSTPKKLEKSLSSNEPHFSFFKFKNNEKPSVCRKLNFDEDFDIGIEFSTV